MSSTVIPKEHLSAYQRWEMASFDVAQPKPQQDDAEAARKNAEMLAAQREEARQQGYADGFEQGRAAGFDAGQAEVIRELVPLRQVADAFGSEVARTHDTVADEMLDLALDLAKAMIKTALAVRPELVLPIVSEAIRYLPSVQQPAILALHPQDAEIVRTHMSDELAKAGWRVTEDIHMERGGCRVETGTNQIDASPQVRWQRIASALGKQPDWLE